MHGSKFHYDYNFPIESQVLFTGINNRISHMDIRCAIQRHGKTHRVTSQENAKYMKDPKGTRNAYAVYEEADTASALIQAGQLTITCNTNLGKIPKQPEYQSLSIHINSELIRYNFNTKILKI